MKGDMKKERRNMFCIKKRAEILYANEYFGVVIKVLTINFSWTDIHGKIFWQALKWLLLPGEDDDTFIPGYDVLLKQLHLRAWCKWDQADTWGGIHPSEGACAEWRCLPQSEYPWAPFRPTGEPVSEVSEL